MTVSMGFGPNHPTGCIRKCLREPFLNAHECYLCKGYNQYEMDDSPIHSDLCVLCKDETDNYSAVVGQGLTTPNMTKEEIERVRRAVTYIPVHTECSMKLYRTVEGD